MMDLQQRPKLPSTCRPYAPRDRVEPRPYWVACATERGTEGPFRPVASVSVSGCTFSDYLRDGADIIEVQLNEAKNGFFSGEGDVQLRCFGVA